MTCPRCHTAEMNEKDRSGVKIDVCPSCRGVWLDRGELDKLIADSVAALRHRDEHEANDDDANGRTRRPRHGDGDGDGDDDRGRRWWDIFG